MSELTKNNTPKVRSSNLELLRIIAMLSIMASHSVINAGIPDLFDYNNISANMLFLQLFAMWGKTAINAFVMISGYFMCTSKLTIKRFSKVYLEVKFYAIVLFAVFLILGYEALSFKRLFDLVFGVIRGINGGFTSSFIAFYLFIPFYNLLIGAMNKKQHLSLIIALVCLFSVGATIFASPYVYSEFTWFIVLYFIAAYIRLYPEKWMNNNKICAPVLAGLILCVYAFVVLVDFVGSKFGFTSITYLSSDSNKILAMLIGVFAFLTFKNLNIKNSKFINTVASTTFGVFLIHSGSDAARKLIWFDIFDMRGHYTMPLIKVMLYWCFAVAAVFIVCSLIDLIRIYCIEKPFFKWLDRFEWINKPIFF